MDEQPKNVKELLVESKDAAELMVDLAYAAVFFDEEKLAREVDHQLRGVLGLDEQILDVLRLFIHGRLLPRLT